MKIKKTSLTEIFSGNYKVLSEEDKVLFYLDEDKNITKINSKNMNSYFIKTDSGELLESKVEGDNNGIFTILHRDTETKTKFNVSFEIVNKDNDLLLLPKKIRFIYYNGSKKDLFLDLDIHDIKIINTSKNNTHISYKDKEENFVEIKHDGYETKKYINGELKEVNTKNKKIKYSSFDFEGQECKSELIIITYAGNAIKSESRNKVKNAETNELVYTVFLTKKHSGDTEEVRKTISGEVIETIITENGRKKEIKKTNSENELIEKYVNNKLVFSLKRSGNLKDGVDVVIEEFSGSKRKLIKEIQKEKNKDVDNRASINYIHSEKHIEVFENDKLISKESVISNDKETVTTMENLLTGEKSIEISLNLLDEKGKIIGKDVKKESFLHGKLIVRDHLEEINGESKVKTIEKFDSAEDICSKVIVDIRLKSDKFILGKPLDIREIKTVTEYDGEGNIVNTSSTDSKDELKTFLLNKMKTEYKDDKDYKKEILGR